MEHFDVGPQRLLRESNRVLKKGGLLFVSIPPNTLIRRVFLNPVLSLKYSAKKMLGKKLTFSEYRYTEKEFTPFIKDAGFEIEGVHTDELDPPQNIGLYIDFPRLQSPGKHWILNGAGLFINKVLSVISPALHRGGVLFVCKKK